MAVKSKRQSRRKDKKMKKTFSKREKRVLTKEQIKERKRRRKESARRHRKEYWTTGKKIALGLCFVLLLLIAAAVAFVASKMSLIQTVELNPDKLNINSDLEYEETGYLNVALFGVDTRANDEEMGTRSDTIMIASLNRETKEVKIVSIYRDTLLEQKDGSFNKANASYSFGGAEEAISMMNRNLDLDIQHYVTVDFAALVHVIDAVGGIEVDVTEEEIPYINGYAVEIIENTGVDTWAVTDPGYQNLTGVQATAYARIRATEGDDFKRTERQRLVLTKVAEKLQQSDLSTLNKIIDKVFPMVETNFTMTEILMYAKDVTKYYFGETSGFPYDVSTMVYGAAGDCVIPVTLLSNVKQLHTELFPDMSYSPSYQVQDISSTIISSTGIGYYVDSEEDYQDLESGTQTEDYSYNSENGTTEGDVFENYNNGQVYSEGVY